MDERSGYHPDDRLESWKEIAAYLNRGVRTVQRWEKREGLPVYRHRHDKRGTVHAFRTEIDAWREKRTEGGSATDGSCPAAASQPESQSTHRVGGGVALRGLLSRYREARLRVRLGLIFLFGLAVIVVWIGVLNGSWRGHV